MKKFIIIISAIILVFLSLDWLYFHEGIYLDIGKEKPVQTFMKVDRGEIYME